MLCSGLTTILMIMINGLFLIHSCSGREIVLRYGPTISPQVAIRHHENFRNISNYSLYSVNENGRTKPIKNRQRRLRDLEQIIIKLKNVIDRYDVKKNELKVLFNGVADYGRKRYGKFRGLLPENQQLKDFNCRKFKHRKILKKRTYKLLSKFHSIIVHSFHEKFQELINFEESPRFKKEDRSNGSRLKILHELKNDLKTLGVEVAEIIDAEAVKRNKRLSFPCQPKNMAPAVLPSPISQTDLMIREWGIIQHSKDFLKDWKEKLQKMCECWKKRRNETDFRKRKGGFMHLNLTA